MIAPNTAAEPQSGDNAAWIACANLASEPRILNRMAAELERAGLVGEGRAAKLVYLVLTSRFLDDRPLCAVIRGQSSAGKSHLVERVMALFPPSAYHFMTSMSPKALAYGEESLVHRILVVAEAAGFSKGDNALLLRSLISEGRIRHETVESTADFGLRSRVTEREGPTGLLVTTTTPKLEVELETRMFSIPINDSPEQTKAIMMATALRWDGSGGIGALDTTPWHALQNWLADAEHRVVIPFAPRLVPLIPPAAVRLRRDSNVLMALIATHALLHQAQREQDAKGRIIATTDDYAAVRELIADLMSEGVGASVPKTVRETVAAVRALGNGGHSITEIAKQLGLHKTTAGARVEVAIEAGYLRNLEPKPGLPAIIVIGDPLPEEVEVLPPPEMLSAPPL
jgi:hypothetical protein